MYVAPRLEPSPLLLLVTLSGWLHGPCTLRYPTTPHPRNTHTHTHTWSPHLLFAVVGASRFAARPAPTEPSEGEIDAMLVDIPVASDGTQKINWIMFLTMFADKMEGASASVADAGGRAKLCGGSPPWLAGRASERGPKGVSVCRPSLTGASRVRASPPQARTLRK